MNKEEVFALGVPEEKYKDFQYFYNRDLEKAANRKRTLEDAESQTRSAINAMLNLIKRPETLRNILVYVNSAYFKEV